MVIEIPTKETIEDDIKYICFYDLYEFKKAKDVIEEIASHYEVTGEIIEEICPDWRGVYDYQRADRTPPKPKRLYLLLESLVKGYPDKTKEQIIADVCQRYDLKEGKFKSRYTRWERVIDKARKESQIEHSYKGSISLEQAYRNHHPNIPEGEFIASEVILGFNDYTTEDVCKIIGIVPETVGRWGKDSTLKAVSHTREKEGGSYNKYKEECKRWHKLTEEKFWRRVKRKEFESPKLGGIIYYYSGYDIANLLIYCWIQTKLGPNPTYHFFREEKENRYMNMIAKIPEKISVTELSDRIRLSRRRIRKKINTGEIEAKKGDHGWWKISRQEVEKLYKMYVISKP